MRVIKKGNAPDFLVERQKEAQRKGLNSADAYALLTAKERHELLDLLMKEQGYLCAYCTRRLPDKRVPEEEREDIPPVSIEHWIPRRTNSQRDIGQGLDYNNMLAVCSGNRRKRPNKRKNGKLTCDAKRKAEYDLLSLNPCDEKTLRNVFYTEDGYMHSSEDKEEDDINVKLNLNCISDNVQLPEMRRKKLLVLQEEMNLHENDLKDFCKRLLDFFENEQGEKEEYSGILIYYLKEKIAALS